MKNAKKVTICNSAVFCIEVTSQTCHTIATKPFPYLSVHSGDVCKMQCAHGEIYIQSFIKQTERIARYVRVVCRFVASDYRIQCYIHIVEYMYVTLTCDIFLFSILFFAHCYYVLCAAATPCNGNALSFVGVMSDIFIFDSFQIVCIFCLIFVVISSTVFHQNSLIYCK